MKRNFLVIPLTVMLLIALLPRPLLKAQAADSSTQPYLVSELPFEIGERLVFKLRYGFIAAGQAEMKVLALKNNGFGHYYHIQSTARSSRSFDWFYKVRDVVNSYMDAKRLYSIHFEKLLREGGYKADTFVDYVYQDSVARVKFLRYKDGMKIKKKKRMKLKFRLLACLTLCLLFITFGRWI